MPHREHFRGAGDDGAGGAVFGDHLSCFSGFGDGDDVLGAQIHGGGDGGVGDGIGDIGTQFTAALAETGLIVDVGFGALSDGRHNLDGFFGVIAGSGLAGEHDGRGAIVDGVCHVGGFRTGGTGVMDHGFQHLGGGDDLLAVFVGFFDEAFLEDGNVLKGNFHAHVAPGDHNAVGDPDDLV